jgi:hypothetical protein
MRRRRKAFTAAVVGCAALLAVGCSRQPHPTLNELKKIPATSIVYPGSVGPGVGGSDSNNKFGVNAAIFERIQLTNDSAAQVLTFYQQQLTDQGWTRDDAVAQGIAYLTQSWGWTMGKRRISLGIIGGDYKASFQQRLPQYAAYSTMYEVFLQ